jgi:guanylate kinase
MNNKKIFIISGPSGAGEDSIIKGLKKQMDIDMPITTTTRSMRENEYEGYPYYFTTKEDFKKRIDAGEFFEWAQQDNNNLYGVTHSELESVRKSNKVAIWKMDYKGVITAKKLLKDEVIAIFINCSSKQLVRRIKKRDKASDEFIARRMEYAKGWLENRSIFDYEVVNNDGNLEQSIKQVKKIIQDNTNT